MFATLFSVTLFAALAFQGVFADFTIDTPSLTQCGSVQINWTASSPPYDLLVVPADDPCDEALVDPGQQTGLSYEWNVALASGTEVVFFIEDSQGNEAWSGTMTVGASSESSCLTSTPPTTPSPAGTALTNPATAANSTTTSTTYSPAGAANAGLAPSGALSIRPLSALTSVGSGLFALFALVL
ncbi:uncharacterized protein BJ212DRAFT_1327254 [Suillus subaureus]|uniref:Uncharacterized protein n=1 Tax=Suillus subaureus TaxID=48587 RepID=A0A9P7EL49_9AGAM|nr:uncharacterized protein BJ212DRAFT_1327254 [Suillus subaureus]KAG1823947.1 hypothetical protein BJ212DRAFT_1327254 [Suillus subaureus]